MENFIRRNSGTVSRIQFNLGTWVYHSRCITSHDFKVIRSKIKVTRSRKVIKNV